MSDSITSNTALKEALLRARESQKGVEEQEIRMPVNIPASYKNKLKVMAAVENTSMKALILEALEMLFDSRAVK